MYSRVRATLPPQFLANARDLPPRAQKQLRVELRTNVQRPLQRDVDKLLSPAPGPVRLPFIFASEKSRRAYFATYGFGRGIPYRRTGKLGQSWVVIITPRFADNTVTIKNLRPEATYVYGPRQVPGHARTGWAKDFPRKFDELMARLNTLTSQAWLRSVQYAIRTAR